MIGVSVQAVLNHVPLSELGTTLMHEHLFNNLGEAVRPGIAPFVRDVADKPAHCGCRSGTFLAPCR